MAFGPSPTEGFGAFPKEKLLTHFKQHDFDDFHAEAFPTRPVSNSILQRIEFWDYSVGKTGLDQKASIQSGRARRRASGLAGRRQKLAAGKAAEHS